MFNLGKEWNFDNTFSQLNKIKNDVTKSAKIIDIVVQAIFIGAYIFLLVSNLDNVVRIVLYSIIIAILGGYFIFHVSTIWITDPKFIAARNKKIRKILKWIKFAVCVVALCFTCYEIIVFGASDLTKMLTIVSFAGLIVSIIFEVISVVVNAYIDRVIVAFRMDLENHNVIKAIAKGMGYDSSFEENEKEKLRDKIQKDAAIYKENKPERPKLGKVIFDAAVLATTQKIGLLKDNLKINTLSLIYKNDANELMVSEQRQTKLENILAKLTPILSEENCKIAFAVISYLIELPNIGASAPVSAISILLALINKKTNRLNNDETFVYAVKKLGQDFVNFLIQNTDPGNSDKQAS